VKRFVVYFTVLSQDLTYTSVPNRLHSVCTEDNLQTAVYKLHIICNEQVFSMEISSYKKIVEIRGNNSVNETGVTDNAVL
jgi:hypothetical protein